MSDTALYIIVGVLILHFLAGVGFLLFKILGLKTGRLLEELPDEKKEEILNALKESEDETTLISREDFLKKKMCISATLPVDQNGLDLVRQAHQPSLGHRRFDLTEAEEKMRRCRIFSPAS